MPEAIFQSVSQNRRHGRYHIIDKIASELNRKECGNKKYEEKYHQTGKLHFFNLPVISGLYVFIRAVNQNNIQVPCQHNQKLGQQSNRQRQRNSHFRVSTIQNSKYGGKNTRDLRIGRYASTHRNYAHIHQLYASTHQKTRLHIPQQKSDERSRKNRTEIIQ